MLSVLVAVVVALVMGVVGVLPAACSRTDGYSQDSPDAVIKTAKMMVEQGHADRLTTLIYAENEDWRQFLRRLGVMLGHLQTLGAAVQESFPKEIDALKAQAEAAAKKGQATGLLQQFTGQKSPFQRRGKGVAPPSAAEQKRQQDAINAAIKRLFADPYAFLEESSGHLTTTMVSDDIAAVLWDNQPVLPPVGLSMKREIIKGKETWYVILPTNLPMLSNYMPRTKEEFKVFGSLVATLDNMVLDLTKDVKEKRVTSMEQIASKAGEKVLIPAAMVFYAYSKAVEARAKPAPAVKAPGPG